MRKLSLWVMLDRPTKLTLKEERRRKGEGGVERKNKSPTGMVQKFMSNAFYITADYNLSLSKNLTSPMVVGAAL